MNKYPYLSSDSLRDIISSHVFYALTIVLLGISVYHSIPSPLWNNVGIPIIFLVSGSIAMTSLSLFSSIRCHTLTKLANELRQNLSDDYKETDEEKEH